ncbi:hypothetical protein A3860_35850 [Niastella vici]|uniref:Uncharacterized protein n=1 Tax=Niastella vici TaxID=1703345 RepID=A0A1V9FNH7_9BACT|nr:hypothetical protein [Niastella vici]OQP59888.1 hypothetical protein A3860_35850 [Niastella vici]
MGEELQSADFIALKTDILDTIDRLNNDYQMFNEEIAAAIRISKHSFHKYSRGKLPPTKIGKCKNILKKLTRLENRKKLEKVENKEEAAQNVPNPNPLTEQIKTKAEEAKDPVNKYFVCNYYSLNINPEPYKGYVHKIGVRTIVKGLDAIIGYPNDSIQFEDADTLVPMLDRGGEPSVRFESLIAIKKININSCKPGNQYYFFDSIHQPYLRTLYKIDGDTYKFIAEDPGKFPDIELKREEILVIFTVITSVNKPKPNITFIVPLDNQADVTKEIKGNQDGNTNDNESMIELNNPEG